MGLKRTLNRSENRNIYPYPDAYFRVENVNSSNGNLSFSVYGYPDKGSRDGVVAGDPAMPVPPMMHGGERDRIIFDRGYSVPASQLSVPTVQPGEKLNDVMKRAVYAHIKTLDEFKASTDVFEDGQV